MNLRDTLIRNGVDPGDADRMLDDLTSEDEATARRAYRRSLRALTPEILAALIELAKEAGKK